MMWERMPWMSATDLTSHNQCVQVLLPISSVMDIIEGIEEEVEIVEVVVEVL